MKTCGSCKTEKDLEQFSWRNKTKGLKMAWCKTCIKAYDAARHKTEEYKADKKVKRLNRLELNRAYIALYLISNPCIDCGIKDVRVLDFDHRDDVIKVGNISDMMHRTSLETIIKEVEKCDVRCSNCHRIRTGLQFGHWRSTMIAQVDDNGLPMF